MNFQPVSFAKRGLSVVLGCLCVGVGGYRSVASGAPSMGEVIPRSPDAKKYAAMAAHSPFAPPTPAAPIPVAPPPPPPPPGWADSLTGKSLMQFGNRYSMVIVDPQNPQHLYLTMDPDPVTQMAIASVQWSNVADEKPTITLRKGQEFAQVKYEPDGMGSTGGGSMPVAPRPPMPQATSPASQGGGVQRYNPPPVQGRGVVNNVRRPIIRSQPVPQSPGQNGVQNAVVRRNPAAQVDDDDDD